MKNFTHLTHLSVFHLNQASVQTSKGAKETDLSNRVILQIYE